MQVGGLFLLLSSLIAYSSAQSTPEASLTVAGDALRSDLYKKNRPPPTEDGCSTNAASNLALKMPVALSSTASGSPGAGATDGDVKKCAKTTSSSNPWLRIDLGMTKRVGKVFLYLPTAAALNGLQVYVGEDTTSGGTKNALCATVATAKKPWTVVTCSNAVNGRYIFLRLPGTSKTINVCEVAAFAGCPPTTYCPNVALRRPTYQSTICSGGVASRGVDGRLSTSYPSGSCTHSCSQTSPWWFVDLQQWRVVNRVLVTNRGDCCDTRLNGFEVWVGINRSPPGNGSPNIKCTVPARVGKGATVSVTCPANTVGQYVYVRIPGNKKILTLCEVQVFEACPTSQIPCTDTMCKRGKEANVALGRPTKQSTNYNSVYLAKNAVDGSFATNIKYCTHTQTQTDPWWYVDLGCERTVAKVTVTNRGDCCGSRLNGFKIAVGNDVSLNGGIGNTPCGGGYTVSQGATLMVECPRLKGRYVTVFLKGSGKVLQLCQVQVFEACDQTCYNLALGQPSTQSNGNFLQAANDGNRNTNYWGRSCYLSYTTNNPYYTLDLGHVRKVWKVRLWNRGDCSGCSNGLDNFEIRFGWSSTGTSNPVCYNGNPTRYSVAKHQSVDVVCNANRLGRYVTVIEYGRRQLGICEIEVYDKGNCYDTGCFNVAKKRGASMSSIYSSSFSASKAIDGNYWSKSMSAGSCAHTNTQTNPWFRVDLWQEMIVKKVYIANRGDCCSDRLTNFMIRVGSSSANSGNNNPICRQKLPTLGKGAYVSYACPNMRGRYVNLQIIKTGGILNFCELQVCATLTPNSALGKPTVQSSTGYGGSSLRAVDGDPNTRYSSGSCTHTNTEKNPWWRVDLQQELIVTSVRVTNRGDCCGSRLYGMEIRVGSSLDFEGNNNAKCTTSTLNIPQGRTWTIMCNDGAGLKGRYVNILLPGDNKVLTICEVMVFGMEDKKCQLSGLTKWGCGQPCPAKTGGIGCHQCPAGQTGRLRHVDSGLCVVPDKNRTFPANNDLLVMSDKCDGLESLFLYSPSNLLYHVASGSCVHILNGGFTAIEGQALVFWYGCDPRQNRLQYTIDDNHFKNVRTKQCIRVKAHNPSPGDTLNLYKDCTHGAVDYEFAIDSGSMKKWNLALNIRTNDARFGYFSNNWANATYFGNATNSGASAWLPAYDNVLVDKIGVQINGIDRVVELPDDVKGKWTLKDLVLRDGSISYFPAVKGQLDPFNFQLSSSPNSYCTNIGTNQQILDNQQWPSCHSMARIGVPMASPLRSGVFKLQMGPKCIHISGGGFGTPPDNAELVAWDNCYEDRLRFTYRTDGSFLHSSNLKCLGLRDSKPVKGTRVVIKPCSASAKFTWRSDGVIVLKSNNKLCWAIEGNSATPGNGKRIQLSDGCNPSSNPMFQFRMNEGLFDAPCGRPLAVEGVGLYYGCSHSSGAAGRMVGNSLTFKPAAVWVYGKPSCNPLTSSGCNSRVGYCTCKNGYFGSACEYSCPQGRFGRNCRAICQCKNGADCAATDGKCTCKPGYRGTTCADLCAPGYYGLGCKLCNCSATASGCDVFTGKCTCPAGFGGDRCDQKCGSGAYKNMWGPNCANKCTCVNGTCDPTTGTCTCFAGYLGIDCSNPCARGLYGLNCAKSCYCRHQSSCDHVTGKCNCVAGYTGADCGTPCDPLHCGSGCNQRCQCAKGSCDSLTCGCSCNDGYTGDKCDKLCPSGMYGKDCSKKCLCHTQATCDHVTGACTCTAGLSGKYCNITCPKGKYGVNCQQSCSCAHGKCDSAVGTCLCEPGWKGSKCDTQCPAGTFGLDCKEKCVCSSNVITDVCNHISGNCICQFGFYGVKCDNNCPGHKWGPNCENNCTCQNSGSCDPNDGSCECNPGYTGTQCENICAAGKFGVQCQYSCTCSKSNSACSPIDGTCVCNPGYRGHDCNDACASGTWGLDCAQSCTCVNGICDPVTGQCQCDRGWSGRDCDVQCPGGKYGLRCASTCQCDPSASCSPVDGSCTCAPGMQGKYCNLTCHGFYGHGCLARCPPCESQNVIVPLDCEPDTGKCQCKPGWDGVLCQDSCRIGWWGDGCQNPCLCKSGGICHHVTGNCTCLPGKSGLLCESDCPDGWYGENCQFKCQCAHTQLCAKDTGACVCLPGWKDNLCTERCDANTYGQNCEGKCNCQNGECEPEFGVCSCDDGFMGDDCSKPCNSTTWGPNCENTCLCDNNEVCHPTEGTCECPVGWIGDSCENSCPDGYYGRGCQSVCKCVNGDCDHETGSCNCTTGYYGDTCQNKCLNNTFGDNCATACNCRAGELCNSETGECYILSVVSDQLAQQAVDDGLNSKDVTAIAASIAVGTILVVLMVLVFLYCKRRVDANGSLAAAYSAQGGDVSFAPMSTMEKDSGMRDGFDNPMYDEFKNDMYSDPVRENPVYGSNDDGLQEAIVADAD